MINSITTELKDYKVTLGNGSFRIELEYTLEQGTSPNFSRNGRITLIFYKREGYSNHFLRYSDPRFIESFIIFLARDEYLSVVDMLRNESPIFFHCRIAYSRNGAVPNGRHEISKYSFSTDKEQIGEDDFDETA